MPPDIIVELCQYVEIYIYPKLIKKKGKIQVCCYANEHLFITKFQAIRNYKATISRILSGGWVFSKAFDVPDLG